MTTQTSARLVYGVGINDSAEKITRYAVVDGKSKIVWRCPFYKVWSHMLTRCYCKKYKSKYATYSDCSVCPEWLFFSNFKRWMQGQKWQGMNLDKDLIRAGNKVYSPDNCLFVSQEVNNFIVESEKARGIYPVGVTQDSKNGGYAARISIDGVQRRIGKFDSPAMAHMAWLEAKITQAKILASKQLDLRVARALVARYENYKAEIMNEKNEVKHAPAADVVPVARNQIKRMADDLAYAIYNLADAKVEDLKPGVVESTCPTRTALIVERNLRALLNGGRS